MRQQFLCSAVLFSCFISFQAFATSGLFPELQKKEAPVESSQSNDSFELFDETKEIDLNANPEEEFQEIKEENIKAPLPEVQAKPSAKKEKKEDENKKQKEQIFEIHPHNIKIITPPTGPNSQFCIGQITLENKTEYNLSELRVSLTYGGSDIPYGFSNVGANDTVTGQINLLGPMCQDLLKEVPVKATTCNAEGLSDAECKSMVKYVIK